MSGPLAKLVSILFLGVLLQSCGKPSHVEGAPRFTAAHITTPGDGAEFSVSRQATRTWKDYDGDGLSDRMDPDIDDDGIYNLCDQYPFDGTKWGEDKDQDGIADFVDLSFAKTKDLQSLASLQEDIFKKLGIVVMNGSESFAKDEWLELHSTLFNEVLMKKLSYQELKVLVRYSKTDQIGESRSDFDSFWKQISFYPNPNHLGNVLAFNGSLVHELGHSHAAENPIEFEAFRSQFFSWSSPSRYGLSSPEEGYAENFVYLLYLSGDIKIDSRRFDLVLN
ncbi:MAG: hypothetical protein K2P81_00275 [Bacteriovoracaceae bacterium]|nr:hypothetical protein [Bacteriovoracaceae bacterium]